MSKPAEQRQFSRVTVTKGAEIGTGVEDIIATRTRDLSLTGLYVYTPVTFDVGTQCGVRIMVGDIERGMVIHARGHVVRVDPDGMAIAFAEIGDTDSFQHLQNLMLAHADDIEAIEDELQTYRETRRGASA